MSERNPQLLIEEGEEWSPVQHSRLSIEQIQSVVGGRDLGQIPLKYKDIAYALSYLVSVEGVDRSKYLWTEKKYENVKILSVSWDNSFSYASIQWQAKLTPRN